MNTKIKHTSRYNQWIKGNLRKKMKTELPWGWGWPQKGMGGHDESKSNQWNKTKIKKWKKKYLRPIRAADRLIFLFIYLCKLKWHLGGTSFDQMVVIWIHIIEVFWSVLLTKYISTMPYDFWQSFFFITLCKTLDPRRGPILTKGQWFKRLGRGPLHNAIH